jgi:ubiquinol-cytochrome c reductase cytochrome b subunit
LGKFFYWVFMANFILLTWIGSKPVEEPFIFVGQISSIIYFSYLLILIPTIGSIENHLIFNKKEQ